ncbi:MAG: DUF4198 domain-containing protein [Pirellulales bacterium]|nr:DUF4198 domain-containing protein [Pirellulales bacterium]
MIACRGLWVLIAALHALVAITGCGSGVDTAPVSGRVTLNGKPLSGAYITCEPISATADAQSIGSYAETDAEGRFTLRLVNTDQPGAMIGPHIVRITTARAVHPEREDSPISQELATAQYRQGVEFTVPEDGTDAATFAMRSGT